MTLIVPFREDTEATTSIQFRAVTDAKWAEGKVTPLATLTHAEIKKLGGEAQLVSAFREAVDAIKAGRPHSPATAAGRFAHDHATQAFYPHQ